MVAVGSRARRALVWLAIVALVVVGGLVVAFGGPSGSSASLDPSSTQPAGSKALARVLAGYGTRVVASRSLDDAREASAVLVTDPDAYSDAQLRSLVRTGARIVLLSPGLRAARIAGAETDEDRDASSEPGCSVPGPVAAGPIDVPGDARAYTGATTCYGGLVTVRGNAVVLGSTDLLRNDHLAGEGVAALDVDLLSADRTAATLVWLRPGADADGAGGASVWDVFPDSWYRAFVWLLLVGVLVVLWRGRRLGAAVTEPLPVVVRSAEIVEGLGRLYARAGARDAAAAGLRTAATRTLAHRVGLPPSASVEQVSAAASPLLGVDPGTIFGMLAGPVPSDDAQLVRLARDLQNLGTPTGRTP